MEDIDEGMDVLYGEGGEYEDDEAECFEFGD
jgi:hypothetical protein